MGKLFNLFDSDTNVNMPGATAEETQLRQLQLQELQKQGSLTDSLLPLLLEDMGIVSDGQGGYKRQLSPEQQKQTDFNKRLLDLQISQLGDPETAGKISKLQSDRTLAALEGKLPLDQGLLDSVQNEETSLRENLRRNLGTGYETSSPGIEALDKFSRSKLATFDAARRGDLSLTEQLGQARSMNNIGSFMQSSDLMDRIRGTRLGQMSSLPGIYSGNISAINPFLQREQDYRMGVGGMQLKSDMFNKQIGLEKFKIFSGAAGALFGGG